MNELGLVAALILALAVCAVAGAAAVLAWRRSAAASERGAEAARRDAERIRSAAEEHASRTLRDAERRLAARDDEVERREARVAERERRLDADARRSEAERARADSRSAELAEWEARLSGVADERRAVLESAASLTAADARRELVAAVEEQAKREAALLVRDLEREARAEGEERARRIITLAVQRLASAQTSESVVSVVQLPNDEMKGRIIGREGRNIRAFEMATGVDLIVDDTPGAVLLSCFDPVRREVGRIALEKLVLDGRIQPQRIEEFHESARAEVDRTCVRAGEDALVETGVTDMHPELLTLLGRLRFRTSYGQNVLAHLVESAHLAGMMASELGVEPGLVKRCALLHDIGKALTHEVAGSHALIGAEIARRYGESDDVVHAIEAHHNEVEVRTVEAVLTQAADAISGGRPGARRESLDAYVERLQRLERIALDHRGVRKVFAMQAGREVRVMVEPDTVDDVQAQVIARDIAKRVEEELTYPGRIRITVIRESRATETAR
ncbi:ribonuclease Y [Murinocardiopsis flavida]|uniref:Ribonuclease Y n=1 Tax=Murinocardiopsis flavida TaxID=645275 RepID=A0A2P8DUT3_9ACTN|nr:ribonuclease Y [Murinocardiopsis flavida]PSL00989.1 ribonuclease Y [Murinocardiopsis flavida]